MKLGIIKEPMPKYLETEAIGRSLLFDIDKEKSVYRALNKVYKSTKAMDFGDAVHKAILEPEIFDKNIIKGPPDRRGNRWKDMLAANKGKIVLVEKEYDSIKVIVDNFLKHNAKGKELLNNCSIEQSCYFKDPTNFLYKKGRADILGTNYIADVKTSLDISRDGFAKSIATHGYHVQAAFYLDIFNEFLNNRLKEFWFIVIENHPPYHGTTFKLHENAIEEGRRIYKSSEIKYLAYIDSQDQAIDIESGDIDLPGWAYGVAECHAGSLPDEILE